jgi:hypothetical protein
MSAPETNLDTRFSDPDAVATSWNDTRQALEEAETRRAEEARARAGCGATSAR